MALNRQEQYWLDCWRRSQQTAPTSTTPRPPRLVLGAMTHGLYAARILNAEERALVTSWQGLVESLREQYPAEEDRIDLLVIYWLFLYRAIHADHAKAIERSGRAIRTHFQKLTRTGDGAQERPEPDWGPLEEQAWEQQVLAEWKKRNNIAENIGEGPSAHA